MTGVRKEGMPWFRMYASVILADTNFRALNEAQAGWYFRLMLETWFRAGFLPDDDDTLRRLAGCRRRDNWDKFKAGVLFFFDRKEHEGQNVLVHADLRKQWLMANESYAKKVERKQLTAGKPTKGMIPVAEFARRLNITESRVRQAQQTGHMPKGELLEEKLLKTVKVG